MNSLKRLLGRLRWMLFGYHDDIIAIKKKIESMDFILRHCLEIQRVPKATGAMRLLQLADAALLKKLAVVLESNNLTYWLDAGTLLGAVRHRGFIPWDDDVDIGMPRQDFSKVEALIKAKFNDKEYSIVRSDCLRLILRGTPCQIDIFPYDTYGIQGKDRSYLSELSQRISALNKKLFVADWSHLRTDGLIIRNKTTQEMDAIAEKTMREIRGAVNAVCYGVEVPLDNRFVLLESKIVPTSRMEFEGYMFSVPGDAKYYLAERYGNYMSFPKMFYSHEDILARITTDCGSSMESLIAEVRSEYPGEASDEAD